MEWPYKSGNVIYKKNNAKDFFKTCTDNFGEYTICNLKPGTYEIWVTDSVRYEPKTIINEKGEYVSSSGGYNFPPVINKLIGKVTVSANDTTNTGVRYLFISTDM